MRVSLTDRFVSGAKAAGGAIQTDFFDERMPGLALRVSSTGRKAWTFIFTSPRDGKRARLTLGGYPASSLADARRRATEAKAHLDEGRDPRDAMAEERAGAMTVADLAASYIAKHAKPNLRSAREIERRLHRNVIPIIGGVKLADLHRRDINRVIDPVLKRERRVEAARVFEDLRAVLRWGANRGDLDTNPMTGMQKPATAAARERVLSDDEIRTLWNGLPKSLPRSQSVQRIIKLCLLTGQRVGEVAGMERGELDLQHGLWSLPGSRTKNGHPHTVPLSPIAVEAVSEALRAAGEDARYVFPNPEGDGPLPAMAVAKTIARGQVADEERPKGRFGLDHWTAHDLRRTAITGMAKLGVAPIVLGHVINHRSVTKAGVTLSVYSHYDYAAEKRAALDLWADRLAAIVKGSGKVVPMRRAQP